MTQAPPALALVLHESDDVAVVIQPAKAGQPIVTQGAVTGHGLTAGSDLPAWHKLALRSLDAGSVIRKYGEVIGRLTQHVAAGEHVHVHNLISQRAH